MIERPSYNVNVLMQIHAWERAKAELKSVVWCIKITPEVGTITTQSDKEQHDIYKKFEKKVNQLISFYEDEILHEAC